MCVHNFSALHLFWPPDFSSHILVFCFHKKPSIFPQNRGCLSEEILFRKFFPFVYVLSPHTLFEMKSGKGFFLQLLKVERIFKSQSEIVTIHWKIFRPILQLFSSISTHKNEKENFSRKSPSLSQYAISSYIVRVT